MTGPQGVTGVQGPTGVAGYSQVNAVDGNVAFGTGGNFHFGPQIRVLRPANAIQALGIGAGAANIPTAGFFRVPYNATDNEPILAAVNSVGLNNVPLLSFGPGGTNRYTVGGTGIRETVYAGATGGVHAFVIAGATEYQFGATGADFEGNVITDVAAIAISNVTTSAPTMGYLRVPYNAADARMVIGGMNAAGSQVVALMDWRQFGTEPNRLTIGDVMPGTGIPGGVQNLHVGFTGGSFHIDIAQVKEYEFGQTGASFEGNALSDVGTMMMRAGHDIYGARRINNVDPLKQYGNLPDSNSVVVGQSGPHFFIPSTNAAGRTYVLIPTMGVFGDLVKIDNRSAFTCTINQSGTGMGTPSGTVAVLAPTMGAEFIFGSGYYAFDRSYRVRGGGAA